MSESLSSPSELRTIQLEEIPAELPALYSQEHEKDPMVYLKYFDPTGSWTWYATEGSPVDAEGLFDTDEEKVDIQFFGLVDGFERELGYFSFIELQSAKRGLEGIRALPIEQDMYFTPCRLSEIKPRGQ